MESARKNAAKKARNPGGDMTKHALAIAFLTALQSVSAYADTDAGMEQLLSLSLEALMATRVKISTNTEIALSKAPSVVSLITAEDIKATGATNVTEILQSIPGIYIRTNDFGFRPWVTMRGASSTQTLLMINGAPIKDLVSSSGLLWKGLPTSMIDRVEVIRGPGSALYGSDASTGVINIITKTAGKIEPSEAGMRAGSFDTQSGWLQHGTNWNGFDIGFTADVSRTNGYSPFIAADRQTTSDNTSGVPPVSYAPGYAHNGYDNQDVRFSVAKEHWRLQADYMQLSNLETGLTGSAVLDPLTRAGNHRYNLDLYYNNAEFAHDWGLNAELRYLHLDYSTGNGTQERPPGYAGAYPQGELSLQRGDENHLNFEASGSYSGFRKHAIRLGGGYVSQDLYSVGQFVNYGTGPTGAPLPTSGPLVSLADTPYAFAPEKARQIRYMFLQDIWTIAPDWELTAGVRHDDYSDFGGTTNPRLALVWQTTDRLTTKLMYGQAFRAPSYQELYANIPGVAVGNPNLKPERSKTLDLSFSYLATPGLQLGMDLYRLRQTDVIGSDTAARYQNISDLSAHGIELEARWQATKTLRFSASASNRVEDYSKLRSFNVPKQTDYLRADWAFRSNWNWDVQANRIGKHVLPAAAPTPIDAYTVVDTTLRYAQGKNWEFAGSIRNLFDKNAQEYVGSTGTAYLPYNLPLPGRSLYMEVRYKL